MCSTVWCSTLQWLTSSRPLALLPAGLPPPLSSPQPHQAFLAMQRAHYTLHCILYIAHYTLYTIQCTVYGVYRLYSVRAAWAGGGQVQVVWLGARQGQSTPASTIGLLPPAGRGGCTNTPPGSGSTVTVTVRAVTPQSHSSHCNRQQQSGQSLSQQSSASSLVFLVTTSCPWTGVTVVF